MEEAVRSVGPSSEDALGAGGSYPVLREKRPVDTHPLPSLSFVLCI